MSAVIGALRGVLSLDSAAFDTGAARAQASMSRLRRSLVRTGQDMQRIGRQMSLRITAPLAGMATVAVRSSLKTVDAQAKMARSFDTSVKSLQVLKRAADLTGISQSDLEGSMTRLTRRLSLAASGTGPAVSALQRLKLTAEEVQAVPMDERIQLIQQRMADLVPEAERAGIASQIFGDRTGIAMMRLDSDAIERASDEIQRFGVAISDVDAAQIEAANDAMSALGQVGRGLANQLTVALAPTLQAIAERAAEVASWFNNLSPEMRRLVAGATAAAAALGPVVLTLGLMATGLAALASPIGLVVLGLGAMIGAGVAVAANWDSLTAKYPALESSSRRVGAALTSAWDRVTERTLATLDATGQLAEAFSDLSDGDLKAALNGLVKAISGVRTPMELAASTWGGIIKDIVLPEWEVSIEEIVEKVRELPSALRDLGKEAVENFKEGILEAWEDVKNSVLDIFTLRGASSEVRRQARATGSELAEGLALGIEDGAARVSSASRKATRGAIDASRDESETRSPSRVFMRIGRDLMQGLADGVLDAAQPAIDAARQVASDAATQASTVVDSLTSAFGDWFANGLRDFETFTNTVMSSFRRLVSDMVATAVANPIRLSMGLGVAGGVGGIAAVGGAAPALQGGNILGSLLPSIFGATGLASGVGAGLSVALGAGSQGLFSVGANALAASSLSGAGLLSTGIGAALPVLGLIGAVAALPSLFRKETEVVDQGIRFQVNQLYADLFEFEKTRTATRFGAGSYGTDFDPLRAEIADPITATIDQARAAVQAMGAAVGMPGNLPFEFGRDIKFEGLSESERQAAVEQAVQDSIVAMADSYFDGVREEFVRAGETSLDALTRMSSALTAVNAVFEQTGQTLFEITREGGAMASELVEAFGGIEGFGGAINTYMQAFYSEEERLVLLTQSLERQLQDLNLAMPGTREEFRALVDSFDLTAEVGREAYATVVSLAGGFDEIFTAAEDAAAAVLEQAQANQELATTASSAADATTSAATAASDAAAREREAAAAAAAAEAERAERQRQLDAARSTLLQNAENALSAAEQTLRASFEARSNTIVAEAAARVDAINASANRRASGLSERSTELGQLRDALVQAVTDRRARDVFDPGGNLRRASTYLADVAAGRRGLNAERLRDAMDVVANPSTDLYASFTDYQRDFARNTAAIEQISERASGQISEAQQQIASIEASRVEQVSAIEEARDAQIERLDQQLAALLGIEAGTVSMSAAIAGLRSAQEAVEGLRQTSQSGFQLGSFGAELDAIYRDVLGRGVRQAGLEYYGAEYVSGVSLDTIRRSIEASEEARRFALTGRPRFSGGGNHVGGFRLVGERGPEIEATGPSRFFSTQQTRDVLGGGNVAGEIRAMRRQIDDLVQEVETQGRDIRRSRERFDQWSTEGLPPERV